MKFNEMTKDDHKKLSSKGGKAKVPKGLARLSQEERMKIVRMGIEKRRLNAEKAK